MPAAAPAPRSAFLWHSLAASSALRSDGVRRAFTALAQTAALHAAGHLGPLDWLPLPEHVRAGAARASREPSLFALYLQQAVQRGGPDCVLSGDLDQPGSHAAPALQAALFAVFSQLLGLRRAVGDGPAAPAGGRISVPDTAALLLDAACLAQRRWLALAQVGAAVGAMAAAGGGCGRRGGGGRDAAWFTRACPLDRSQTRAPTRLTLLAVPPRRPRPPRLHHSR